MGPKVQAHHTVEEAIGQYAGQPHDLELSRHVVWDKWQTNAEQLIDTMIALLPIESRAQQPD
jgi:hypothetical protein